MSEAARRVADRMAEIPPGVPGAPLEGTNTAIRKDTIVCDKPEEWRRQYIDHEHGHAGCGADLRWSSARGRAGATGADQLGQCLGASGRRICVITLEGEAIRFAMDPAVRHLTAGGWRIPEPVERRHRRHQAVEHGANRESGARLFRRYHQCLTILACGMFAATV